MFLDETNSTSAVYGLTCKARCLCSQTAEEDKVRFLVGTLVLKEENEVHLVEVHKDENEIKCLSIYNHPTSEIWHLVSCPFDSNLFFSCYNATSTSSSPTTNLDYKVTLWKMKEDDTNLKEEAQLKGHKGMIKCVLWKPHEANPTPSDSILSLDEECLRIWKLDNSTAREIGNIPLVGKASNVIDTSLSTVCWNPLHEEQIAIAFNNTVKGFDMRTSKETYSISRAHQPFVRDIDFNPNKDYYVVTGGDDYKIKFWDTRKCDQPVKSYGGHSHWVWNVKYNRLHDQFVISSSTDSLVNLWNVSSISSAPTTMTNIDESTPIKLEDGLVKSYEDHEDSVYSIGWATDPFIFASLSYDGRLVINYVPKQYADILSF